MERHRDEIHSASRLEAILAQQPAPPPPPPLPVMQKETDADATGHDDAAGTKKLPRAHKNVYTLPESEARVVYEIVSSEEEDREEKDAVVSWTPPTPHDDEHRIAHNKQSFTAPDATTPTKPTALAAATTTASTLPNKHKTNELPPSSSSALYTASHRALPLPKRCFVCAQPMHDMEPLYHCISCAQSYHGECVHEPRPRPGQSTRRTWSCPRHVCCLCGKAQVVDGALFLCTSCPRSYCFDCLDARLLALDASGLALRYITRCPRNGKEGEGEKEGKAVGGGSVVVRRERVRRSCYYITCLRCTGEESSSSSSSSLSSPSSASSLASEDEEDMESEGRVSERVASTRVTSSTADAEALRSDTNDSDVDVV